MSVDPWGNPTKVYPVGIHSSKISKPNDTYPVYVKGQVIVPGRETVVVQPDGGPNFPFAREYPVYLQPYLVGVHGEQLFHEEEPHWVRNPALPE